MVVGVLKFGIPLLLPLILKYVVDDILMTNASTEEKLNHLFWILGGALFVFTVLRWPIEYYRQYFAQWTASRVLFDIRNRLFDHIQKLSLRYYNNRKVGQIISRVINDVEQTKEFVVTGMMNIWLDLITLSIAVGIMLWMDPRMTLVSLSVFPLYGVAVKYFYQGLRRLTRERSQALAEMQGHLHERIQGISVIRAFNLEKHEQGQFDKQNRHYLGKALAHSRWNAHTFAIVNTITDIAPILVIAFAGYQVIQGNLTIGEMTAFYGYLQLIYSPIRRLVNSSTILTQALASMDRVFEFLDEPYDIQDSSDARSVPQARGEITFRDVRFSYRDGGEEVLRGIDLEIAPGQTIALVGMSGGENPPCSIPASTIFSRVAWKWTEWMYVTGSCPTFGRESGWCFRITFCSAAVCWRISGWEKQMPLLRKWWRRPRRPTPMSSSQNSLMGMTRRSGNGESSSPGAKTASRYCEGVFEGSRLS